MVRARRARALRGLRWRLGRAFALAIAGGPGIAESIAVAKRPPVQVNPEPGVTATGMITLVAAPSTTTIELKIGGLQADSTHVSHIHLGSCQSRGGIAFALNPVIADGQGIADVRSKLELSYPPTGSTWYVVVHAGPDMQGTNARYLLCGNLF
jgi:hypothetical protein